MPPYNPPISEHPPMFEARDIHTGYGEVKVLFGVNIAVNAGEIHCLMGRNGAGKTTLLKAIMGQLPLHQGQITLEGEDLSGLPTHQIPKRGIGYIPQGRGLFPELTVSENIEMGLMTRSEGDDTRNWVLELFPRLQERLYQVAATLSGGEQQMLTTARALCLRPKVLLLDEPTEGLQPSMVDQIRSVVVQMKAEGYAIILVEQRIDAVLSIADRVTFVDNGKDCETLTPSDVDGNSSVLKKYLGV